MSDLYEEDMYAGEEGDILSVAGRNNLHKIESVEPKETGSITYSPSNFRSEALHAVLTTGQYGSAEGVGRMLRDAERVAEWLAGKGTQGHAGTPGTPDEG